MNFTRILVFSFLPALFLLHWCEKPPLSVHVRPAAAVMVGPAESGDSDVPVHPDFRSGQ